jgi:histidinol phosphatase-like PHP family hydrolase
VEQFPTFSTHFCTPFSKGSDLSPDQIENAKEFGKPAIGTKEHNPLRFIVSDTQSFQNEENTIWSYRLKFLCMYYQQKLRKS